MVKTEGQRPGNDISRLFHVYSRIKGTDII